MSKKNVIILILILLLALTLGIIAGIFIFSNDSNPKEKQVKIYPLTLEEMYCNIKDSRRILKIKVTIETTNKETYEEMSQNNFL